MKVTKFNYSMEDKLVDKIKFAMKRQKQKFDHLWILDGDEGYGKSTLAVGLACLIADLSNKNFNVNNIFFNIDEMTDFAVRNESQIILWDEAALGGMGMEHQAAFQKKLVKLLMVARKKQHFWLFCIPKYYALKPYIVERAIGLLHIYSHDDITRGRYVYFNKHNKKQMFSQFQKSRIPNYSNYTFRGRFADLTKLPLVDWEAYESKKDKAILSLADDQTQNRWQTVADRLRVVLGKQTIYLKEIHGESFRKQSQRLNFSHQELSKAHRCYLDSEKRRERLTKGCSTNIEKSRTINKERGIIEDEQLYN